MSTAKDRRDVVDPHEWPDEAAEQLREALNEAVNRR